jgi:superfamily I DNA/RNA helicase
VLNIDDNISCEGALPPVNKVSSNVFIEAISRINQMIFDLRQRKINHESDANPSPFNLLQFLLNDKCKAIRTWATKIQSLNSRLKEEDLLLKRIVEIVIDISGSRKFFNNKRKFSSDGNKEISLDENNEEEDYCDSDDDEDDSEDIIADIEREAVNWDAAKIRGKINYEKESYINEFLEFISASSIEGDKVGISSFVQKSYIISTNQSNSSHHNSYQTHSRNNITPSSSSNNTIPGTDKSWIGTIHKAKGLEWPVVFILKADNDKFQFDAAYYNSKKEQGQESNLKDAYLDAQRLMYVAMTRAQVVQSFYIFTYFILAFTIYHLPSTLCVIFILHQQKLFITFPKATKENTHLRLSPLLAPLIDIARLSQVQQESKYGQLTVVAYGWPYFNKSSTGEIKS